jgi:hypothetical protein
MGPQAGEEVQTATGFRGANRRTALFEWLGLGTIGFVPGVNRDLAVPTSKNKLPKPNVAVADGSSS